MLNKTETRHLRGRMEGLNALQNGCSIVRHDDFAFCGLDLIK